MSLCRRWSYISLNKQGFTLIELLCVICLISISLLLAVPSFSHTIKEKKLEAQAREIAWTIRSAREEAIFSGEPKMVFFYSFSNSYKNSEGVFCPISKDIKMTANFNKIAGVPCCRFAPTGAPNGGTITLINSNGSKRYVIVTPAIGRVRISEKPPDNW